MLALHVLARWSLPVIFRLLKRAGGRERNNNDHGIAFEHYQIRKPRCALRMHACDSCLITRNTTFLQKASWRCLSQKQCPKGKVGASRLLGPWKASTTRNRPHHWPQSRNCNQSNAASERNGSASCKISKRHDSTSGTHRMWRHQHSQDVHQEQFNCPEWSLHIEDWKKKHSGEALPRCFIAYVHVGGLIERGGRDGKVLVTPLLVILLAPGARPPTESTLDVSEFDLVNSIVNRNSMLFGNGARAWRKAAQDAG